MDLAASNARFESSDQESGKRRQVSYSFLFMRASGDQLREITSLIDSAIIKPVMDRVFHFDSTNEAMACVEKGRAKGKVVVNVNQRYGHFSTRRV